MSRSNNNSNYENGEKKKDVSVDDDLYSVDSTVDSSLIDHDDTATNKNNRSHLPITTTRRSSMKGRTQIRLAKKRSNDERELV